MDREAYCAYQASCLLYLDVTITEPQEHIQVLTLRIQIIDENDNAPQFDQDSLGKSLSISIGFVGKVFMKEVILASISHTDV